MIDSLDRASWFLCSFFVMLGSVQVALSLAIAKSNKRQASLFAFLSRPWLDVGRWVIKIEEPDQMHGKPAPQSRQPLENPKHQTDTLSIGIGFEILNRSEFPLAVDSIVILMGRQKQGDWQWTEFQDRSGLMLRPHSPGGDNSEACNVSLKLKGDEVLQYAQNGLYLRLYVKIFYWDAETNRVCQDFAADAMVRAGGSTVFTKSTTRKINEVRRPPSQGP